MASRNSISSLDNGAADALPGLGGFVLASVAVSVSSAAACSSSSPALIRAEHRALDLNGDQPGLQLAQRVPGRGVRVGLRQLRLFAGNLLRRGLHLRFAAT